MFGIDDLVIGGLIASILGAGMQYNAAASAANKTTQANLAAHRRQQQFQEQASRAAMDNAEDFRTENRIEKQQQIEDRLEQEYSAPAMDAQTINAQAATTQGDVSGDYTAAKSASNANVEQLAKNFARLMARTGSAQQLRTNEAYKIADTAANIGRLQNFARGQGAVDQQTISEAANSGAGMNFLGSLIGSIGQAGMMYGGNFGKAIDPLKSLDGVTKEYTSKLGKGLSGNFIGDARGGLF